MTNMTSGVYWQREHVEALDSMIFDDAVSTVDFICRRIDS
jgi:hypothetical protein